MKFKLKIFTTKNLDRFLINKILKLKKTHWKSNLFSQKKWFKKNIFDNDIHILLENNGILIGYVALRKKKYSFDKSDKSIKPILLFDTLIVRNKYRGNGYAEKLVNKTIKISNNLKTLMILSCKKKLLNFYFRLGWGRLKRKNFEVLDDKKLKNFILVYKENLNSRNKILKKKIRIYLNK